MSDITAGLPGPSAATSNETVAPTTSSDPVSVGAGETVSFDQLDAVQQNNTNVPNVNADKADKADKAAKVAKPVNKVEKKAEKKEEVEEPEEIKRESSSEVVEKPKKDVKLYKVKIGDKDLDLASTGNIEIEKDGKTVPVTVQDLVNSYHGTSEIHKRLTDLDVKSKRLDSDRGTVDSFVDKIAEFYKADKPLELVDFLVNTAGLDPAIYRMKLMESMAPELEQFSLMLPEEKKAYQLGLENDYLRKQQEAAIAERQKSQTMGELESKVKTIQQSHGLDDKQFYSLYRELVDEGGYDENDITPQDIAEYADYRAISNHISDQINSINPSYGDVAELTSQLVEEMMDNKALSLEDLKEIIREIVVDTSEEDLKEKLSETPKKVKQTQPKNPMSEPLTFDDLAF